MTIIDGPEEVFNSKEVNKPIVTDKMPINIAMNTICLGLLVIFLDAAAGIISNPVIKRVPIIFIDNAITPASRRVKIILYMLGRIPSAEARSKLTVAENNDFQIKYKITKIIKPPIHTRAMSSTVTDKISPNSNPIISKRILDKKPIKTKPIARVE